MVIFVSLAGDLSLHLSLISIDECIVVTPSLTMLVTVIVDIAVAMMTVVSKGLKQVMVARVRVK